MKQKYYNLTSIDDTGNKVYAAVLFKAAAFEIDPETGDIVPIQSTVEVLGSAVFYYDRSPVSDAEIRADALTGLRLLRSDIPIHSGE